MPRQAPSTVPAYPRQSPVCKLLALAALAISSLSPWLGSACASDPGADGDISEFTLLLPTWTESPQKVEVPRPKEDNLSKFDLDTISDDGQDKREPDQPASATTATAHLKPLPLPPDEAGSATTTPQVASHVSSEAETDVDADTAATSAHLLIPQAAPPMPEPVDFPDWTPASTIWIAGFSSKVDGERQEADGDLITAIASFQNARGAYQLVGKRFPDWQPDIVSYRLADLELRIRLLVQKTATASAAKNK